ncbi:lipopolysaccharide kinase [Hirsutella rhossiliensis]|uniref:Lipopolysaccharide kinase (Kdo/WaaP) family domain-containing protein n=1 Tax=Hirsutella rhossiliensis TaxID=111463 RepID=A0A9P8NAK9_9HYPO|nr:lipopolysaccharide kinase (Kdo/WaaP) family domain-containing protein [Hirsutella rhossiliensis]KAH0967632.1 lipopolysaccharide kinase (Kdo/WaaP) family domain-containing protein [Hirsutella rhossiliensis]
MKEAYSVNGRISREPATEKPHFASVAKEILPGVTKTWHPICIDHLELQLRERLHVGVHEATCPHFASTVAAKFTRFPYEIGYFEKETDAYRLLEGRGIGPPFLGHLAEEGRVIGFIIGLVTDFRHATPNDFGLCRDALTKLHESGFKHGDINKHNFLIHDGRATLIDFELMSRADASERKDELNRLIDELRDTIRLIEEAALWRSPSAAWSIHKRIILVEDEVARE